MKIKNNIRNQVIAWAIGLKCLLARVMKMVLALPVLILAVIFSREDNPFGNSAKGKSREGKMSRKVDIDFKKKKDCMQFSFSSETHIEGESEAENEIDYLDIPQLKS